MDLLDRLVGHDHWATARLLELSRDLADAQLDQSFDIGHRTLRATFEHMIFNVESWTRLMAEQPVNMKRDDRSLAALIERHERSYAAFATLSRRVRDEQRLGNAFVDHFAGRMTFGGAIIHVVLHNAEHRSEALHILARLGVPDCPKSIMAYGTMRGGAAGQTGGDLPIERPSKFRYRGLDGRAVSSIAPASRWRASGRWTSQQRTLQKVSFRRPELQVDTEHR